MSGEFRGMGGITDLVQSYTYFNERYMLRIAPFWSSIL